VLSSVGHGARTAITAKVRCDRSKRNDGGVSVIHFNEGDKRRRAGNALPMVQVDPESNRHIDLQLKD
jgi:hypothetical protein